MVFRKYVKIDPVILTFHECYNVVRVRPKTLSRTPLMDNNFSILYLVQGASPFRKIAKDGDTHTIVM